MISAKMMVVMWTTSLEVLSDLKHLGSMEEPKGEREQVAQRVQVHRIRCSVMYVDRGVTCRDFMMRYSFGHPLPLMPKGERFKREHALRGSMSCCHQ